MGLEIERHPYPASSSCPTPWLLSRARLLGELGRIRPDLDRDDAAAVDTTKLYRDTNEDVTKVEGARGSISMLMGCEAGRWMRRERRGEGEREVGNANEGG